MRAGSFTASGWLWMLRHFGIRTTVWYWRQGHKRGWMTQEQSERFFFEQFGLLPPWIYDGSERGL